MVKCEECNHWKGHHRRKKRLCKRYPPFGSPGSITMYPTTSKEDSCGEFEPKKEETEEKQ